MVVAQTEIDSSAGVNGQLDRLVVFDSGLASLQDLIDDVAARCSYLVIGDDEDGIQAITRFLSQGDRTYSSLHIVSHGAPGEIYLGKTILRLSNLGQYSPELAIWGKKLSDRALSIYGCSVAQGLMGKLFVQAFESLTHCQIAASSSPIGATKVGRNWTLDAAAAPSPVVFSETLKATYSGSFDPIISFRVSTDTLVEEEQTPFSFIFELSEPPPPGGVWVRFEADQPQAISQWDLTILQDPGSSGSVFEGLNTPGNILEDISENQDFSAFLINIVEQEARINLPVFDDPEGLTGPLNALNDGVQPFVWMISESPDPERPTNGTIDPNANSAPVTIFDFRSQVPVEPSEDNTAPVAAADEYVAIAGEPLEVSAADGVLGNDTDADEDDLTAILVEGPSAGAITFESDGSFVYTPGDDFSGSDSFTYRASDGETESAETTVTLNGEAPSAIEVSVSVDNTVLIEDEGSVATITLTLSEPPPPEGLDFDLRGQDNALPDFNILPDFSVTPPPPTVSFEGIQVVAGFPDNSGSSLRFIEQTAAIVLPIFNDLDRVENGTITDRDGPLRNDDIGPEFTTFSISPNENSAVDFEPVEFTLLLKDSDTPDQNPPAFVNDDSYSVESGMSLIVPVDTGVLANDSDFEGESLTAEIVEAPTNGTVTLAPDGSFDYTPSPGFVGVDTFSYSAFDGTSSSTTATVSIDVTPEVNRAPTAEPDVYQGLADQDITIDAAQGVLSNDSDANGDTLVAQIADLPQSGTLSLGEDGSFTYSPNIGFSGVDSFTYTAFDGVEQSLTVQVDLTVFALPEAPENATTGSSSADDIRGNSGNDFLVAFEDDDTLSGRSGNDTLDGGEDDDVLRGGSGVDLIDGGDGDDILKGGRQDDRLTGAEGDDSLRGQKGDDFLAGGAGRDVLMGNRGDDTLAGGAGSDLLDGKGGDDVYVLNPDDVGVDIIRKFRIGRDLIELEGDITFEDITVGGPGQGAITDTGVGTPLSIEGEVFAVVLSIKGGDFNEFNSASNFV
ncbi:MAG: Ig-like domain-containing protein [Cyanobacteria bacterium P01_F01_bin.42]